MMNRHSWPLVLLAASALVLTGCASSGQAGYGPSEPGMSMGPGESMAGMPPSAPQTSDPDGSAHAGGGGDRPSASARMICTSETKDNVAKILGLGSAPHTVDRWSDHLFSCTYHLADGALALSVKESADDGSARVYFDALQQKLGSTQPIDGLANLGLPAYETTDGAVVFVKDNMTLNVDASKLPVAVGPHAVSRTDFAYQVATAVLGCWSGD
ncbi:MAG: hypothetical protein ABI255_00595 [Microbacteriaceae bacterium]